MQVSLSAHVKEAPQGAALKTLGREDFLKLLATQLRYQDPLSPIGHAEFIAQLAQFSALEQMRNLNEGLEKLREELAEARFLEAASLVGREVVAQHNSQTIRGIVERVGFSGGDIWLKVAGQEIPLSAVTEVGLIEPDKDLKNQGGDLP